MSPKMNRTDGKFPAYEKIEIDPEVWPTNYWDSSLKCPSCATLWPNQVLFIMTPCCKVKAKINTGEAPDMRWPEAVKRLLTARFERIYDEWNEGYTDEQLLMEDELADIKSTPEMILQ